jgi:preprotein translocase subunit YajC
MAQVEPGDNVVHPAFGKGKVVSVSGAEVEVRFDSGTKKTLNLQYAPLKKV